MLKNLRNIFITIVTALGFSYIYRAFLRKHGPLVRVLVFHDVQDAVWFKKIIAFAQKQYHVVTPEDFFLRRFDSSRINVLITFDDGYASWVNVCLPILAEKNVQALFFVNSGLIDVYNDSNLQKTYVREQLLLSPRKTLSWEGVRKLSVEGHTIGGHTTTHARLSELSEDMQRAEIIRDKDRIEEMLGVPVSTFAYPFGQQKDYSGVTEKLVKEAGYVHGYTTEASFLSFGSRYRIPRLCIEDVQTTTMFGQFVEGGYDIYHKLKTTCVR